MSKPCTLSAPFAKPPTACGRTTLTSAPDCGHCKQLLFTGKPVDLAEAAFDKHLQAAAQLELRVRVANVAKVDTEAQQALGSRYQIRSIPNMALFVNGLEVARQAGAMSASDIVRCTLENIPG